MLECSGIFWNNLETVEAVLTETRANSPHYMESSGSMAMIKYWYANFLIAMLMALDLLTSVDYKRVL